MEEIEENLPDESDPNNRFGIETVAKFSSVSDVDNFCNQYNHDNGYNGLKIGQKIKILDKYNNYKLWYIAGFDCEANNIASDGTHNNNGYGICLYPFSVIGSNAYWNFQTTGPYKTSTVREDVNEIASSMIDILGDHIIERNVLIGSKLNSSGKTSNYTWNKSYGELLSVGQFTGSFGTYSTIYDDGEANYQLPLFKHFPELVMGYGESVYEFTRNLYSSTLCFIVYYGLAQFDPDYTDNRIVPSFKRTDTASLTGYTTMMIYIR